MIKLKAVMDSSKFKKALARLPQPPVGEPFLGFWGSKPSDKGKVAYVGLYVGDDQAASYAKDKAKYPNLVMFKGVIRRSARDPERRLVLETHSNLGPLKQLAAASVSQSKLPYKFVAMAHGQPEPELDEEVSGHEHDVAPEQDQEGQRAAEEIKGKLSAIFSDILKAKKHPLKGAKVGQLNDTVVRLLKEHDYEGALAAVNALKMLVEKTLTAPKQLVQGAVGGHAVDQDLLDHLKAIGPRFQRVMKTKGGFQHDLSQLLNIIKVNATQDVETAKLAMQQLEELLPKAEEACGNLERARDVQAGKQRRRHEKLRELLDPEELRRKCFPRGKAREYRGNKFLPGKDFTKFLDKLEACERDPSPENIQATEERARDYLARYAQLTPEEQNTPERLRKKEICDGVIQLCVNCRTANDLERLPEPPWDTATEHRVAELYCKVIFESGDKNARPNRQEGTATNTSSWWIEKNVPGEDGEEPQTSKKFLFKPMDGDRGMPGFPPGGSPGREVLSKVLSDHIQGLTGLGINVPETRLVAIDRSKLAGVDGEVDPTQAGVPSLGSLQHFSKSQGELKDLIARDPNFLQTIPEEECQKMALFDLISLNTDRHDGNLLVGNGEGGQPRLLPIDHGLSLPSRLGLDDRRFNLGNPHSVVTKMPGSEKPFSEDMRHHLDTLDPDQVVQSMRDSLATMRQLHPEAVEASGLSEEHIKLVGRSIRFLKEAAAQGLSVNEIYDAYVRDTEKIFDSSEEDQEVAFGQAMQGARDRSEDRQAMTVLRNNPDEYNAAEAIVKDLGWGYDMPDNDLRGWVVRNEKLFLTVYRTRKENPAARRAMQHMLDEMDEQRKATLGLEGRTLGSAYQAVSNAYSLMKKRQDREFAESLGLEGRTETSQMVAKAYRDAVGEVGMAQLLQEPDLARRKQHVDEHIAQQIQAWTDDGSRAAMERTLPDMKDATGDRLFRALAAWQEYQELGGNPVYYRLGGNGEVGTPWERVDTLRGYMLLNDGFEEAKE